MIEFPLEFHWYLYTEDQLEKASIGSGNGLALNSLQAITWNNADPVHWCIYAALGGDELILMSEQTGLKFFR